MNAPHRALTGPAVRRRSAALLAAVALTSGGLAVVAAPAQAAAPSGPFCMGANFALRRPPRR
ncbi:hypothetical protein ACFQBS_23460 [Planomonospora parontospora]|uniref:hypothetical protein n=1 Tax=Planomonospora parontospora TaxID=58119 RepID=UPI003607350D